MDVTVSAHMTHPRQPIVGSMVRPQLVASQLRDCDKNLLVVGVLEIFFFLFCFLMLKILVIVKVMMVKV